jgi:tetratricopeptide (TPR) repeat protein
MLWLLASNIAERHFQESMKVIETSQNRQIRASCQMALATLYCQLGKLAEAETCYQTACAIYDQPEDSISRAALIVNYAQAKLWYDWQSAAALIQQTLPTWERFGKDRQKAICNMILLLHSSICGEYREDELQKILPILNSQRMGISFKIMARLLLSQIYFIQGQLAEAERLLQEALTLGNQLQTPGLRVQTLTFLGGVKLRQDQLAEAERLLQEALTLSNQLQTPWLRRLTLTFLGGVKLGQGQLAEAERLLQEALTLSNQLQTPWLRGLTLTVLGLVKLLQDQPAEAQQLLQQVLSIYQQLGDEKAIQNILGELANISNSQEATQPIDEKSDSHQGNN